MESLPPYFQDKDEWLGHSHHIQAHLKCLLNSTAMTYAGHNWRPGFHTVFYALSYDHESFGQWPHGDLYGDRMNRTFGKKTFTVIPPSTTFSSQRMLILQRFSQSLQKPLAGRTYFQRTGQSLYLHQQVGANQKRS